MFYVEGVSLGYRKLHNLNKNIALTFVELFYTIILIGRQYIMYKLKKSCQYECY